MDFLLGGLSGVFAGVFTNPLDVVKTRQTLHGELVPRSIQISKYEPYRGVFRSFKSIYSTEGVRGLQTGLRSALLYLFVHNGVRLGLFQIVHDQKLTRFNSSPNKESVALCMLWGGLSGGVACAISCPFFKVKTQLQSSSTGQYKVGYQHNHKGIFHGFSTIIKQQGLSGLWRGCDSFVLRMTVGNMIQLSVFTKFKEFLLQYEVFQKSTFLTASVASGVSGSLAVVIIAPWDVATIRLFNQETDAHGKGKLYKNLSESFIKTYKIEGIRGIYKGIGPTLFRVVPHAMLNFTFWEHLKKYRHIYFPAETV